MKDYLVENLKSIRMVHNLVIISCATLCFLGFPKQPQLNPFSRALEELELAMPTYKSIQTKEVELITQFYERDGSLAVMNEIFEGLPLVPIGNYPWNFDSDSFEIINNRLTRMQGAWEFTNMTVFQINWNPRRKELESWYGRCKQGAKERNSVPEKLTIYSGGRNKKSPTVEVYDKIGKLGGAVLDILDRKEITDNKMAARKLVLESGLVKVVDGDTLTFPRLKSVWDIVKPLTISEARIALKRHSKEFSEQTGGKLSLFGLPIESRYASVVGPVVTISLLFYLLAQLKHLRVLVQDDDDLITSPWVGFFDNRIGKIILLFTITVLPSLSSILIVSVSDFSGMQKWLFALLYCVSQFSLGFLIVKDTYSLKSAGEVGS